MVGNAHPTSHLPGGWASPCSLLLTRETQVPILLGDLRGTQQKCIVALLGSPGNQPRPPRDSLCLVHGRNSTKGSSCSFSTGEKGESLGIKEGREGTFTHRDSLLLADNPHNSFPRWVPASPPWWGARSCHRDSHTTLSRPLGGVLPVPWTSCAPAPASEHLVLGVF